MNSLEKKVAEKKKREQEFSFNLDNLPPIETPKTHENTGFFEPVQQQNPSSNYINPVAIKVEEPKEISQSIPLFEPVHQMHDTKPVEQLHQTQLATNQETQNYKTTLSSLKKTFKAQTLSISTKNLAYLDVVSSIKNESQKEFLDKILNEYFEKQNYDSEILKLVQNKVELIEANIHKN